jgi:hypothetical protein
MRGAGTNTLFVDYAHLLAFDDPLAQAIADEFVRFEAWVKAALQDFIRDRFEDFLYDGDSAEPKDFFVAFYNMPAHLKCGRAARREPRAGAANLRAAAASPRPPPPPP